MRLWLYLAALTALAACQPVVVAPPPEPAPEAIQSPGVTPTPSPVAEADKPPIALPPTPTTLTKAGFNLITEFEGWAARPELPDLRYSGVSWAYGYDAHQNSKEIILEDWAALPPPQPNRLAATQPFYGRSAVQPARDVRDILIPHAVGDDVFIRVDMSRVYAQCRQVMPEFDNLRPNAQSAIASLIFNRGPGMSGNNRTEMREIRDLVPKRDYDGIALNFRRMVRVWVGTSIEVGMRRRRLAEADLVLTP